MGLFPFLAIFLVHLMEVNKLTNEDVKIFEGLETIMDMLPTEEYDYEVAAVKDEDGININTTKM